MNIRIPCICGAKFTSKLNKLFRYSIRLITGRNREWKNLESKSYTHCYRRRVVWCDMWREVTTWEAGRSIRRRRWEKSQIGSNRIGEHRIGTHQLTRSRASWAPLPASRDDCASPRWHTWVGRAGDRESSLRSPPWSHQSPSRFAAPAAPSSPLRYTTLKINFSGVYSSLILANGVPLLEFICIQRLSGTDYWHIKLILIYTYTYMRVMSTNA